MAVPSRARDSADASRAEQLRLITKVARLYHEHGVRQPEIARRLHLSQPRVSRLLKQAVQEGIVRTTVVVPSGVQTELEERLEDAYGLRDAVVVESTPEEETLTEDLGVATASYLEATLTGDEVVGISSWSSTLLAAVDAMRILGRPGAARAIQLFGGVGDPAAAGHAARLLHRFAELSGARPTLLMVPGIAASPEARAALLEDRFVQQAMAALDDVTLALVGIGTTEPSPLLQSSGNVFSEDELQALRDRGAVGDICLRFFDRRGRDVPSDLDERVIGVTLEQLRRVPRSIGVAGGARKFEAIQGALLTGAVNVLVTDHGTAERLLAEAPPRSARGADVPLPG